MKNSLIIIVSVVIGVILTPITLYVGAGGHGVMFPLYILFPFCLFITAILNIGGTGSLFLILLMIAQYTIYGVALVIGNNMGKLKETLFSLLLLHAAAVCLLIFMINVWVW